MKNQGQATLEYLILLSIMAVVALKSASMFGLFLSDSFGDFARVLSVYLSVGVCKDNCFWAGYINGYEN